VFLAYMRKGFTKKEVKWSYCRVYKKEFTSEELGGILLKNIFF